METIVAHPLWTCRAAAYVHVSMCEQIDNGVAADENKGAHLYNPRYALRFPGGHHVWYTRVTRRSIYSKKKHISIDCVCVRART